jgi:hypothetical protein
MGMKRLSIMLILLLFMPLAFVQAAKSFKIKYVSSENVYLDAGGADGLSVGDSLEIPKDNLDTIRLEVVFVAEHSSSCKIIKASQPVIIGDRAFLVEKTGVAILQSSMPIIDTPKTIQTPAIPLSENKPKLPKARING